MKTVCKLNTTVQKVYVKEQFMNTIREKKQPDELTNNENTKSNIMPDYLHKILTIIVNIAQLP